MTNEWIWDKIRSKLTRAEEMKKYLKEIRNATHQTEQYAVKPRIQGR